MASMIRTKSFDDPLKGTKAYEILKFIRENQPVSSMQLKTKFWHSPDTKTFSANGTLAKSKSVVFKRVPLECDGVVTKIIRNDFSLSPHGEAVVKDPRQVYKKGDGRAPIEIKTKVAAEYIRGKVAGTLTLHKLEEKYGVSYATICRWVKHFQKTGQVPQINFTVFNGNGQALKRYWRERRKAEKREVLRAEAKV